MFRIVDEASFGHLDESGGRPAGGASTALIPRCRRCLASPMAVAAPVAVGRPITDQIAMGTLVEELKVSVSKPSRACLGLTLEGSYQPMVIGAPADHEAVVPGDIVVAVNGRAAKGAIRTARYIRRSTEVEITLWRPVRRR